MFVKQISIQLENEPGKLSRISGLLGREGINIRAISVAETTDLSIIRLITDNPEKTFVILSQQGYHVKKRDVIAAEVPDHPGALNAILKPLSDCGINVQYLYTYLGRKGDNAIMILRVDKGEEAVEVLKKNWVKLLSEEELYSL